MFRIGQVIKNIPLGRFLILPMRAQTAGRYCLPKAKQVLSWLIKSREHTNLTYNLSELNFAYLTHTLSLVTGAPLEVMETFLCEPLQDHTLIDFISRTARIRDAQTVDDECRFGRRLGWYGLVRYLQPQLVVETGVDKGLGSVLLCSALMKNAEAGYPGEYMGTDINPMAGLLLQPPYTKFGKIAYGDSLQSLRTISKPIDLFINDSDHSAEYEYQEYLTIADKLSPSAIILGDNSHRTDKLMQFSRETGRDFIFFREEPADHWFPGCGIGFSFKKRC